MCINHQQNTLSQLNVNTYCFMYYILIYISGLNKPPSGRLQFQGK